MYSRNRVMTAEARYAENLPPVYGGSRFYRGSSPAVKEVDPLERVVAVGTPEAGIPVQYEARLPEIPAPPLTEEADDISALCAEEIVETAVCAAEETPTTHTAVKPIGREGGLISFFKGDSEELLLIALILLLAGEGEQCADVLVILILLLVVR